MQATLNLPELTGSPKQIAWAESIRRDTLAAMEADKVDPTKGTAASILAMDSAKFWIETRNVSGVRMGLVAAYILNDGLDLFTAMRKACVR